MRTGKRARGKATRGAGKRPKIGGKAASPGSGSCTKLQQTQSISAITPAATPTYEQIAQRAEHIWRQGGCLPGRDEQNWHEAEAQLKAELHAN